MARPSSLTSERRDAVERALAAGAPLNIAAASAGVSKRTVSRWLEDGSVARRELSVVPESERDLADDATVQRELLESVFAAASRGEWRAATWILERRWPDRYGRR
jgi:transposase